MPGSPRDQAAPEPAAPHTPPHTPPRFNAAVAAVSRELGHPAVLVLGLSICVAFLMRALFFEACAWLWHFATPVNIWDITPWARWAMLRRDGAEPYALIAAVVLQWLVTGAGLALLLRLPGPWRAVFGVALLAEAAALALELRPLPPLAAVHPTASWAVGFTVGCVVATWLLTRAMRRRGWIQMVLAVALVPLCLVPFAWTNLPDLTCILQPALRIQQGMPLAQTYFQYDLLPSLLALVWIELGGAPAAFSVLIGITYYAFFLCLFGLARRLFRRSELAAPLLISVLLVRFYGFDGLAAPQVTPMRLDLWLVPLAAVYFFGLRHWSVGLALGGLCFFSRSVSPLLIGAYGLTFAVEFLATRSVLRTRLPVHRALLQAARQTAPVWGGVLIGLLASRLVFGSFGSDALALYRQFEVGMMRIARSSFYWWLLALTGGAGCWVVWKRAKLSTRQGQTAMFAVALVLASSVYFFGRSHENNLINTSVPFLLCLFLVLDLAWPTRIERVPALRLAFRCAPWFTVATCAYYYSARAGERLIAAQFTELVTMSPRLQRNSPQPVPPIDCDEIARAAPEHRVLFFTKDDYWYYQACDYVAPGYIQPVHLALFKKPLIHDMNTWLQSGYRIFVPRGDDWVGGSFGEFRSQLPALDTTLTTHFNVYSVHR